MVADVELAVGSQTNVNVTLDLGQTTETVEVKAASTEVNATTASVGSVVEARRILDLPLVGRNARDLVATQARVVINGTEGVNINGSQTGAINHTTDGINTQNNILNGPFNAMVANTVSIDRVEEFRVATSPADAEYGRGSGADPTDYSRRYQINIEAAPGKSCATPIWTRTTGSTTRRPESHHTSAAGARQCPGAQSNHLALRRLFETQQSVFQWGHRSSRRPKASAGVPTRQLRKPLAASDTVHARQASP